MNPVIYNLRLKELVTIVQANRQFYEDFVIFLQEQEYLNIIAFIQERSDERAKEVISIYLTRKSEAKLYDGILQPYPPDRARWYFLAWLLRDAANQRLQPLLQSVPGQTMIERKSNLLNEIRKFVEPLFPSAENWEWGAISEIMLTRLEGSRRALKGTLFEALIRRILQQIIEEQHLELHVTNRQVRLQDETYDIEIRGPRGQILFPVKTRETMGGGHANLFTRDIYKAIYVATEQGIICIPIVIAESWTADLSIFESSMYIHIRANPNQLTEIEPLLVTELQKLIPFLTTIA